MISLVDIDHFALTVVCIANFEHDIYDHFLLSLLVEIFWNCSSLILSQATVFNAAKIKMLISLT